jgi:hypothetical protein
MTILYLGFSNSTSLICLHSKALGAGPIYNPMLRELTSDYYGNKSVVQTDSSVSK